MTRHLLQSLARMAHLAPQYVAMATDAGLPSPARISARVMRLHLCALAAGQRVDRRAAPLQVAGVAIVQQDVPHIPITFASRRLV